MTILEAREQQGIEQGRLEGLLLGRRETAKNLLRMGLSPEQAAKAAELPLKEIVQLKKEIEN